MARATIKISSMLGGHAPSFYLSSPSQFLNSLSIDPDFPVTSGDVKASASLVSIAYEDFSSTGVDTAPLWTITNPKNALVYFYLDNGKLVSYNSSLASETSVVTITSSGGNGAAYYNNFLYLAKNADVARYGPLDGTPATTQAFWTSTLSKTALTDTTYPTVRSVEIPNHPMHVHSDNKLYIGDVVDGQGVVHFIRTKKVTNQGDTDDGSTEKALDLPFGYYPTAIASYGIDLAIVAIQTSSDTVLNQGNAALFLWNTTADSFYRQVPLPDPLVTALHNHNGALTIFSGSLDNGVKVSQYTGGDFVKTLDLREEGTPPFAGAVDSIGDRLVWGSYTTANNPSLSASVFSLGSKNPNLPMGRQNIIKTTSSGANPNVTTLKVVQQASLSEPRVVVGWRDDSGDGIDKLDTNSSETLGATWRSQMFNVGRPFIIKRIRLPFSKAVAANMTLTPKIYVDGDISTGSTADKVINNTNFPNSGKQALLYPDISGENSFFLELAWTNTVTLPVLMPIEIEIETQEFAQP